MRKYVIAPMAAFLGVLALTSVAAAQRGAGGGAAGGAGRGAGPRVPEGYVSDGVPKMPNPPGPAPKQDLSGAWVGPQNNKPDPVPPMTPAGQAIFKTRKKYLGFDVTEAPGGKLPTSNDPFTICDPLGFPRDLLAQAVSSRGGTLFGSAPGRILIMYEQQRVWREIWMDGRALPTKIDVPGGAESRYYGYSVGHWDGDNTFVIDTTGLDERAWLDEAGHPRSATAHIQERYNRKDQYNMHVTVTVNDPKYYTKPFTFMNADFYWMKAQEYAETICVPSDAIEYRDALAKPSGLGIEMPK